MGGGGAIAPLPLPLATLVQHIINNFTSKTSKSWGERLT